MLISVRLEKQQVRIFKDSKGRLHRGEVLVSVPMISETLTTIRDAVEFYCDLYNRVAIWEDGFSHSFRHCHTLYTGALSNFAKRQPLVDFMADYGLTFEVLADDQDEAENVGFEIGRQIKEALQKNFIQ